MIKCLFVSDLHGRTEQYNKLFQQITLELPQIVFVGGDILPSGAMHFVNSNPSVSNFVNDFLIPKFLELKQTLVEKYPRIFLILGNDDPRCDERAIIEGDSIGLWTYANMKSFGYENFTITGYQYVPPTPFQLKDWEKYDVSRYIDPGCVSPEEGRRTTPVEESVIRYGTIKKDLEKLTQDLNFEKVVFLFHSPPYKTNLDRAALDGKMIDYVPLDVNVGSIAIKKLIETKQPYLTLHGHVHESTRITNVWKDKAGTTQMFGAAHDGSELCVIIFDLEKLEDATRKLI